MRKRIGFYVKIPFFSGAGECKIAIKLASNSGDKFFALSIAFFAM